MRLINAVIALSGQAGYESLTQGLVILDNVEDRLEHCNLKGGKVVSIKPPLLRKCVLDAMPSSPDSEEGIGPVIESCILTHIELPPCHCKGCSII